MTIVDNFFQVNRYDAVPNSLSEEVAMEKIMQSHPLSQNFGKVKAKGKASLGFLKVGQRR